jgi:hypothetical protein
MSNRSDLSTNSGNGKNHSVDTNYTSFSKSRKNLNKRSKEQLVRILRRYLDGDNIFTSPYLKDARGELIRELIAWKHD